MDKEHIKMISAFEQSAGFLGEFATMLAAYHIQLCDKGFQRPEALILVKELQSILFAQAFNLTAPEKGEFDEE
jgi:hypothetical protein